MLGPGGSTSDDATWELARHAAATLANTFLAEGVGVVVAEGSFNTPGDRTAFTERLDPSGGPQFVTLRVTYEEALRRAQGDPTRGMSRDPAFLGRYFAAHRALAVGPATDIVIDTEAMSATSAAAAIASLLPRVPTLAAPPRKRSAQGDDLVTDGDLAVRQDQGPQAGAMGKGLEDRLA